MLETNPTWRTTPQKIQTYSGIVLNCSMGGTTNNHLRKIQAVVNNCARFVIGMNKDQTSTPMAACN